MKAHYAGFKDVYQADAIACPFTGQDERDDEVRNGTGSPHGICWDFQLPKLDLARAQCSGSLIMCVVRVSPACALHEMHSGDRAQRREKDERGSLFSKDMMECTNHLGEIVSQRLEMSVVVPCRPCCYGNGIILFYPNPLEPVMLI